tara:strand:- start:21561 stop:23171 length:1611 start_codon:yes stop_codon:yes gene_type:complete
MARRSPNLIPMNWNSNNNNFNMKQILRNIANNNNDIIRATPLYPTLYSVVVDSGESINISRAFTTPKNSSTIQGIKIEVLSIIGRAGRFQKVREATKEYGVVGGSANTQLDALEFKIRVTKNGEEKGGTVRVYKNGKMTISCGYVGIDYNRSMDKQINEQPNRVRSYIASKYFNNNIPLSIIPFTFANISGQFRINSAVNPDKITEAMIPGSTDIIYNPEISAMLKVKYPTWQMSISVSGHFQIMGIKSAPALMEAYRTAMGVVDKLIGTRALRGAISRKPVQPRKTKASKTKTNKPAPEVTRRGTTCPKGHRPEPYSFQGRCPKPDHYVRPNPQGQPCCYKIPRSLKYSANKVKAAYNKAGVKVPANVRRIFGFGTNTNNKPNNVTSANLTITVRNDPKSGFMIGSRQAKRYTREGLHNIAKRMKIAGINGTMTKDNLINEIKKSNKAKNVSLNGANLRYGGKVIKIRGRMIGKRVCDTFRKDDIRAIARGLGLNIDPSLKKSEMCDAIQRFANKATNNQKALANELDRAFANNN